MNYAVHNSARHCSLYFCLPFKFPCGMCTSVLDLLRMHTYACNILIYFRLATTLLMSKRVIHCSIDYQCRSCTRWDAWPAYMRAHPGQSDFISVWHCSLPCPSTNMLCNVSMNWWRPHISLATVCGKKLLACAVHPFHLSFDGWWCLQDFACLLLDRILLMRKRQ